MVLTITIPDDVAEQLRRKANEEQRSIEDVAAEMLDEALAAEYIPPTPEEVVAKAKLLPRNPDAVRPAEGSLLEYLRQTTPEADPEFDLEAWTREWEAVEAEMKAITLANDIAEGRR
jgi:plasmid stability protein